MNFESVSVELKLLLWGMEQPFSCQSPKIGEKVSVLPPHFNSFTDIVYSLHECTESCYYVAR